MIGDDDPEELDKKPSLRARRPTRVAPPKQKALDPWDEEASLDADVDVDEDAQEETAPAAESASTTEAPAQAEASVEAPREPRRGAPSVVESRPPRERPRARRPSGVEARPERVDAKPPSIPAGERPSVRAARRVVARASEAPLRTIAPAARSSSVPPARAGSTERAAWSGAPAQGGDVLGSSDAPSSEARASSASERPSIQPSDGPGAVLVTGICGRLGRLLARDLHRVDSVIGVDRRPFADRPKDIVFHELDLRRKKTRDIFRGGRVRAVVHLGIIHDPRTSVRDRHTWNVVAFQKLLEYMTHYQVRKLVVLSSANVYGPQPDNPQFLTEEAPLLGSQEFGGIRDLVALDMLAQSHFWRHPDVETVILRPCHIVGSVRNAPSNYLRLARPITLLGFDPMVQMIHERDVVQAIMMALRPGVRGIFNLRGQGELPLSRVLQRLGKRPRAIPGPVARLAVDRMWRLHLGSFPSPELDHVRYVCMVDDTRAREVLGFTPRYTLDETLEAVTAPL
jgi:UDP-glucose 4-epimerase